jgi:hypothetical protein
MNYDMSMQHAKQIQLTSRGQLLTLILPATASDRCVSKTTWKQCSYTAGSAGAKPAEAKKKRREAWR